MEVLGLQYCSVQTEGSMRVKTIGQLKEADEDKTLMVTVMTDVATGGNVVLVAGGAQ